MAVSSRIRKPESRLVSQRQPFRPEVDAAVFLPGPSGPIAGPPTVESPPTRVSGHMAWGGERPNFAKFHAELLMVRVHLAQPIVHQHVDQDFAGIDAVRVLRTAVVDCGVR
jgi:hypothetical protein